MNERSVDNCLTLPKNGVLINSEPVVLHSCDVLLQYSLQLPLHERQLAIFVFRFQEVVLEREILLELIDSGKLVVVILNHQIVEIIHRGSIAVVKDIVNEDVQQQLTDN